MIIDNITNGQISTNSIIDNGSSYISNDETGLTNKVSQTKENSKSSDEKGKEYTKKDLDKVVGKLNKLLEDEKVHSEYSYNKDFRMIMIKIVNDDTKETILEIPPKKIIDMLANMFRNMGILDKKV